MKENDYRAFRKLLSQREMDVPSLADQIFSNRSHLTQVLLGQRKGTITWDKLKKVLTEDEYNMAKKYADAQLVKREKAGESDGAFPQLAGSPNGS